MLMSGVSYTISRQFPLYADRVRLQNVFNYPIRGFEMNSISFGAFLLTLLLSLGSAPDKPPIKGAAEPSAPDREFVQKAARLGLTEVAAGNLASAKANNTEVKRFGTPMRAGHDKANVELTKTAKAKDIALPKSGTK